MTTERRKFPAHTTAELELNIAPYRVLNPPLAKKMEEEVLRRKAGLSKPFVTPQIAKSRGQQ